MLKLAENAWLINGVFVISAKIVTAAMFWFQGQFIVLIPEEVG